MLLLLGTRTNERHGNAGKTSHNAKMQVREDFQRFIDRYETEYTMDL